MTLPYLLAGLEQAITRPATSPNLLPVLHSREVPVSHIYQRRMREGLVEGLTKLGNADTHAHAQEQRSGGKFLSKDKGFDPCHKIGGRCFW
ncbi:uncharacterized protein BP01DRAFT_355441 [Aspergillus saccharolyticus JOP 1030-1]|uniref:Uncharacterized protein n=1 Tax=Aspergillus saccharolyticus JOP 1030-1 TaxID=1450539 RepID=A0A318ZG31_9EURO|nr:hypothetical protein BP01DRAFT_355441 [Aspergillus saccharolyticus JOP 1030-1]PYH46409.1 hypothetical protein BP01DRAFT_355441 [Aspergillus saccharolyticus JOP 1030-1]